MLDSFRSESTVGKLAVTSPSQKTEDLPVLALFEIFADASTAE